MSLTKMYQLLMPYSSLAFSNLSRESVGIIYSSTRANNMVNAGNSQGRPSKFINVVQHFMSSRLSASPEHEACQTLSSLMSAFYKENSLK